MDLTNATVAVLSAFWIGVAVGVDENEGFMVVAGGITFIFVTTAAAKGLGWW